VPDPYPNITSNIFVFFQVCIRLRTEFAWEEVEVLLFRISAKKTAVFLLCLLITAAVVYVIYEQNKIIPTDLLRESMEKTFSAKSYSFGVKSTLLVDGKERKLSDIKGKKDGENNYYFKGTMLQQDVEVYQIQDTTHFRERSSDKWMHMEDNNIMDMQQFTTEINPLSNFSFSVPELVTLVGKEKIEGKKYVVLECAPHVENQILNMHWKNFEYKFWIDKGKKVICKAQVTAENKENAKSLLKLEMTLGDFNKVDTIVPPIME